MGVPVDFEIQDRADLNRHHGYQLLLGRGTIGARKGSLGAVLSYWAPFAQRCCR